MLRLVLMIAAAGFALTMEEAVAQYNKTGYTGADCSACGDMWPWSPACRWSNPRRLQTGWYRVGLGDAGSTKCQGFEEEKPTEDVTFEMGAQYSYQLKQGNWLDFGLDFTVGFTRTRNVKITQPNKCGEGERCLTPLKAFCRYSYHQQVSDRQIATEAIIVYAPGPNGVAVAHKVNSGWQNCSGCSPQTKRFSVLCKDPSPEMISAAQASYTPQPYHPPLETIDTYCACQ